MLAGLIPRKRVDNNLQGLPELGLSGWQTTKPQDKNHRVNFCIPLDLHPSTLAINLFIYYASVMLVAL
jgi:hypothetical protein